MRNGIPTGFEAIDVPVHTIPDAQAEAPSSGRDQVVGLDPYFGWVYRDADDAGGVANLETRILVPAKNRGRYRTLSGEPSAVKMRAGKWYIEAI
jgi:hypothetical protein